MLAAEAADSPVLTGEPVLEKPRKQIKA